MEELDKQSKEKPLSEKEEKELKTGLSIKQDIILKLKEKREQEDEYERVRREQERERGIEKAQEKVKQELQAAEEKIRCVRTSFLKTRLIRSIGSEPLKKKEHHAGSYLIA